jgi:Spy/CpxP family protein refolding chaperone
MSAKKDKRGWVLLWAGLLTLGLLSPSWADMGAQGAGKRFAQRAKNRQPLRDRIKKLDLSKEQKEKLFQHRADFRKRMAEIKAKIQLRKVDLENEMEKPKPDAKKVESLTQEIKDLMKERRTERTKATQELAQTLTPEQMEKWKQIEKE